MKEEKKSLIDIVQGALQSLGYLRKGNFTPGKWCSATNNVYRSWCANNSNNRWAHQPLSLEDTCPALRKVIEGTEPVGDPIQVVTPEPIVHNSGFSASDYIESPYVADDLDFEPTDEPNEEPEIVTEVHEKPASLVEDVAESIEDLSVFDTDTGDGVDED